MKPATSGRRLRASAATATREGGFSRDLELRGQIRAAAVAVMSNVAEGFDRGGNREFRQFLSVAKASAAEVKSQLYVALDAGYIDGRSFGTIYGLAEEAGRLIGGLMRYLQRSGARGTKFRQV